jgi:hypothetical protein
MLSKSAPIKARKAKLQAEALKLRIEGNRFTEIAEALGVSKASASRYVRQALAVKTEEVVARADELRELVAARLDQLWKGLLPTALGGDCKAASTLVAVLARYCKLYGLDAPVKLDVKGQAGPSKPLANMSDSELLVYARRAGLKIDGFTDDPVAPALVDSSRRPPLTYAETARVVAQGVNDPREKQG